MSPMTAPLVLSLFPGIGLLDMAFEEAGFCVVRGPDLLWGGDVRRFHPPAGKFDGVIGGPPCQQFSQVNQAARKGIQTLAPNLIPEFERVVGEAGPRWFVMENVTAAPLPIVPGFVVEAVLLNNRWLGAEQNRVRRFSLGTADGRRLNIAPSLAVFDSIEKHGCFTANGTQWDASKGRSRSSRTNKDLRHGLRLQGLPESHLDSAPFTAAMKIRVVGNGVPLPMGRAVAKAVRRAMYPDWQSEEGAA